jgi:hypothetical protein
LASDLAQKASEIDVKENKNRRSDNMLIKPLLDKEFSKVIELYKA